MVILLWLFQFSMFLWVQPVPLFNKIEESMAKSLKERFAGKQQISKATTQSGGDDTASLPQQLEKQVHNYT